ncbi:hypothetical protein [Pseudomonas plecoglossicida]|uniref:hypothetical protein n=1 Tax=Pseudomonas plecoglossicida TaxID=70775 RepID=UPI0012E0C3B8|nr:hypothetical protein [Pseudomonas plecoglossicida]
MKPPPITKSQALAEWMKELQNEHLRLSNPEAFLRSAVWRLGEVEKLGLFDPLELYEMREQAHAAYSSGLEEQFTHELYCQSSAYNVVPEAGGVRIAIIGHGVYSRMPASDEVCALPSYHGRVVVADGRVHLLLSEPACCITISGLRFVTEDGIPCRLVETARLANGRWLSGVNDPDAYRALVDLAQAAFEQKNWALYRRLSDRVRFSPFACCMGCNDSFAAREDCEKCGGLGFTPASLGDPVCAEG